MALTVQQDFVIGYLQKNDDHVATAIEKMRTRAGNTFLASVALMSFVTAGGLGVPGIRLESISALASIVCGAIVSVLAILIYRAHDRSLPGCCSDPEQLRDDYLDVPEDDAVMQVISDMSSCYSDNMSRNLRVSGLLTMTLWTFVAQVFFVVVAVGVRMFA